MSKINQIQWIIEWYWEQYKVYGNKASLDAQNFELESEFIESTGCELSYQIWRSRIRDAASEIGLKGVRLYNYGWKAFSGVPKFSMVYL